jgi:pantothenate kinase-related protein Tda10
MGELNLAGPVAGAEAANPLHQALFGGEAERAGDPQPDLAALAPVYRAAMADLGIRQPQETYLLDLILPLVRFFRQRIPTTRAPFLIGLAGGPGAGKTTLSRLLSRCLAAAMLPPPDCLSLSIDDFYHPREERLRRGFRWRTLPGTHDTARIGDFIAALDRPGTGPLTVPRYDLGRDAPMAEEALTGRPDICIFDGAMVGSPLPGYDRLAARIDFLIFLDLPTALLKQWRFERERKLREASGGAVGFSEDQMQAFWDEALGPSIDKWVAPNARRADLVLSMDADRRVTAAQRPQLCRTGTPE